MAATLRQARVATSTSTSRPTERRLDSVSMRCHTLKRWLKGLTRCSQPRLRILPVSSTVRGPFRVDACRSQRGQGRAQCRCVGRCARAAGAAASVLVILLSDADAEVRRIALDSIPADVTPALRGALEKIAGNDPYAALQQRSTEILARRR